MKTTSETLFWSNQYYKLSSEDIFNCTVQGIKCPYSKYHWLTDVRVRLEHLVVILGGALNYL